MSSRYLGKAKPYNRFAVLRYQQEMIERAYPFLHCRIINRVLVCKGVLRPHDCDQEYMIKIEYVAGHEPKSTILYPRIEPSRKIHMYKDHSLCLCYSRDIQWTEKIRIYEYTVPWISEWIHYYEIYLLNGGVWEGPESPSHMREEDQNINVETD
jgi:hypothetical protein